MRLARHHLVAVGEGGPAALPKAELVDARMALDPFTRSEDGNRGGLVPSAATNSRTAASKACRCARDSLRRSRRARLGASNVGDTPSRPGRRARPRRP